MNTAIRITETARLILRHFTSDDLQDMVEVLGHPEVMKFSLSGPLSLEQTRDFIDRTIAGYADRGFGLWAVQEKSSNRVIGYCGNYFPIIDGVEEVELGYRLARSYWGRGLATEAAKAAMRYSFETQKLSRLVAMIDPENLASITVVRKCGFRYEKSSTFHDISINVYSLSSEDYYRIA